MPLINKGDVYTLRLTGLPHKGLRTTAQLLVEAALLEGAFIQAAPNQEDYVAGRENIFIRVSRDPILLRDWPKLYDSALICDLLSSPSNLAEEELKKDGILLVNTRKGLRELAKTVKFHGRLLPFNSSEIAQYFLENDYSSLALVGAWLKLAPLVSLSTVEKVCRDRYHNRWKEELIEKNVISLKMGYNELLL